MSQHKYGLTFLSVLANGIVEFGDHDDNGRGAEEAKEPDQILRINCEEEEEKNQEDKLDVLILENHGIFSSFRDVHGHLLRPSTWIK